MTTFFYVKEQNGTHPGLMKKKIIISNSKRLEPPTPILILCRLVKSHNNIHACIVHRVLYIKNRELIIIISLE